ncbi:hypothetical protein SGGMMB4_04165 [Sodalis glossinidius str. 'morsitans']|uniref:Uncharacterized protein n=1 Tax=Sodalis glossinidius (strain morsitans) TaxID=343509 RepID=A0A193QLC4_SODGM|nr:hypothetical protein [Sodalis glossinidius]CRL45967.1 hypothetical protein SGGMMB4_04165 [Sodalis glossinidius str. 'morsitans']
MRLIDFPLLTVGGPDAVNALTAVRQLATTTHNCSPPPFFACKRQTRISLIARLNSLGARVSRTVAYKLVNPNHGDLFAPSSHCKRVLSPYFKGNAEVGGQSQKPCPAAFNLITAAAPVAVAKDKRLT